MSRSTRTRDHVSRWVVERSPTLRSLLECAPVPTPPGDSGVSAIGTGVRAALIHDWLQGFHGSERVVEAIRTGLFEPPGPDVLTFHADRHLLPPDLAAAVVRESRLGRAMGERWRYLLPYMPLYFAHLDLAGYDLVVSSSHACAFHVRPPEGTLHVCYCHTPMRYAWLPQADERRLGRGAQLALRSFAPWLRHRDRRAAVGPDSFIANSTAVADRIHRFLGREATVIHPPVDVNDFRLDGHKEPGLFLCVHRLIPYKRPDVVVEAFRGLPYRLTMVGVGPLEAELRARLPPNVELRQWLPRGELAELFASASGFIHIGEEDFGISMVEALAAGTPVIALDRGGARDIVRPDIDGLLLGAATVEGVRRAVKELRRRHWDRIELRRRAEEFDRARFDARMRNHVAALLD